MSWHLLNLSLAFPDIAAKAAAAIAQVQAGISKLDKQSAAMTTAANSALDALAVSKGDLAKITAAGFYMIKLSPQQGAWDTRLGNASGEPTGSAYCCGVANIVLGADLQAALDKFTKIKDALKKPIDDAKAFIGGKDFSDYTPSVPDDPSLLDTLDMSEFTAPDWDTLFGSDVWHSAKLGDVFGGAMQGIASASNGAIKDAKAVFNNLNQARKITAGLSKGATTAQNLLADMAATGTYSIILEPGVGNYLTRLRAESGAPESSTSMYSSGYVCIAVAPDATALAEKFATLTKVLGA